MRVKDAGSLIDSNDEIHIDYTEDYTKDNEGVYTYSLWITRWRDETDEEYTQRMEKEAKAALLKGGTVKIAISQEVYNALVDKAWKYDQLNK
jgi:hypothetical protein